MPSMMIPIKSKGGGGALPEYRSNAQPYTEGQGVSARFDASGSQAAMQGLNMLANAQNNLGRAGEAVGRMAIAFQERDKDIDLLKAQEAYAKLQNEGIAMQQELYRLKGKDALGDKEAGIPSVEERMRTWYEQRSAELGKDLGQWGSRYFGMYAGHYGGQMQTWAMKHQDSEFKTYQNTANTLALDAEGQNLMNCINDPDIAMASAGRIRGIIERQGRANGWDDNVIGQAFNKELLSRFDKAIDMKVASGDIQGAFASIAMYTPMIGGSAASVLYEKVREKQAAEASNFLQQGKYDEAAALSDMTPPKGMTGYGDVKAPQDIRPVYVQPGGVQGNVNLPADVKAMAVTAAQKYGLDPVIFQAMLMQESGGRMLPVNSAGAMGIAQVLPKYAKDFDPKGELDINTPAGNIELGARELAKYLQDYGGDYAKALIAYNSGPARLNAFLKGQGAPLSKEGASYVRMVFGRISGDGVNVDTPAAIKLRTINQTASGMSQGQQIFDVCGEDAQKASDMLKAIDNQKVREAASSQYETLVSANAAQRKVEERAAAQRTGEEILGIFEQYKKDPMTARMILKNSIEEARIKAETGTTIDKQRYQALKDFSSKLTEDLESPDNTVNSSFGARVIRAAIDKQGRMTEKEVYALSVQYGLNKADTKAVLAYAGGAKDKYPESYIMGVAKGIDKDFVKDSAKLNRLYNAFLIAATSGNNVGNDLKEKDVKEIVYGLMKEEQASGWFSGKSSSLVDVTIGGKDGKEKPSLFRPKMPEYYENNYYKTMLDANPWFKDVPAEGRKLYAMAAYMKERWGTILEFSPEEKRLMTPKGK